MFFLMGLSQVERSMNDGRTTSTMIFAELSAEPYSTSPVVYLDIILIFSLARENRKTKK